jgi:hypothetical protein
LDYPKGLTAEILVMDDIISTAKSWLTDFFDPKVKEEIHHLIENDTEELKERFYKKVLMRWLMSQTYSL